MRSNNSKQAGKNQTKPANQAKQQPKSQAKKPETPKKEFQKSSSSLFLNEGIIETPKGEPKPIEVPIDKEPVEIKEQEPAQIKEQELFQDQEQKDIEPIEQVMDKSVEKEVLETQGEVKIQEQIENEIVDAKYGDQKIDLSEIKDNLQEFQQIINAGDIDPSRPQNLCLDNNQNEPLPSYSNRVNLQEFAVGNYKEFQLKEELSHLIEKYNKQFNPNAQKPALSKLEIKETKYQDKMITNPIAIPDPGSVDNNFSWMYLMTPYYNQLVKDFSANQMENHVLKQHFEYFVQMQEEKDLLSEEFELLKQSERALMDKMNNGNSENQILEDKVRNLERNLSQVQPERIREVNDKLDNLNSVLSAKDGVIDQLLNEISLVKNEKDDLQNEVLFKKQKIENFNIEFNTKELEYQRLWEEQQQLKSEIRGDTNDSKLLRRENEMMMREIAAQRDEINQNSQVLEMTQAKIMEAKSLIPDYENRLRYANDFIMGIETESQQINLDIAQSKATIEGQIRAYNELRSNYYLLSSGSEQGKLQYNSSSQMMSIPKVVMPSSYYRPSPGISRGSINLMPSTSKALSQQVPPSNIKSYLSIKKATIDLTYDIKEKQRSAVRDQKVRFSNEEQSMDNGFSNLPINNRSQIDYQQQPRRSDSMDLRIERKNLKGILSQDNDNISLRQSDNIHLRQSAFTSVTQQNNQQINQRAGSVNRNFVDTMSGIMGMSEDKQKVVNIRASQASNVFPLRKIDVEQVDSLVNSPMKNYNQSPDKDLRNTMDTELSADYYGRTQNLNDSEMGRPSINSTMWTQTPLKNKVSTRGGPGNRSNQPQQMNSVKQKAQPSSTRHQMQPPQKEEEKYRQSTWSERMDQLPKQSAYRSSITFANDGMTVKEVQKQSPSQYQYQQPEQAHPFQVAKDYDIDIEQMNEDDPQAKLQIVKFKQQQMFQLTDQRQLLQSQVSHIPEYSKQVSQRQKKQELETDIQKLTKRISMLKYDIKKLNSKAIDD